MRAESVGLKNGDFVSIRNNGIRAEQLDNVLVGVNPNFDIRAYLDVDEADALYIKNSEKVGLMTLSNYVI